MLEEIRGTLNQLIEGVIGLPLATENNGYKPKLLTPWARSTLFPNQAENMTRGDNPMVTFSGTYQLDLFYPSGSSTNLSGAKSSALLAYLYQNRTVSTASDCDIQIVTVTEEIGTQEQDWYSARLVFTYELYKQMI
jgi:hypothetical protein